jgi:hypothetical protein
MRRATVTGIRLRTTVSIALTWAKAWFVQIRTQVQKIRAECSSGLLTRRWTADKIGRCIPKIYNGIEMSIDGE